jgi:hypothetical protein
MRLWIIALVTACFLGLLGSRCWAVVVFPKGGAEPMMGFLVHQDERRIVLRMATASGESREREFLRSEIDDVLFTVSTERLEMLRCDDPRGYRNYAEELAEKRQDPEARETAIRLYLIAAHLDTANLARSSLLGMIDLARNESEQRKFRAMAYLLDPDHDRSLLKPAATVSVAKKDDTTRALLLGALRALRQGQPSAAQRLLTSPMLKDQLAPFQHVLSYEELKTAAQAPKLSPQQLQKVLTVELALTETPDNSDPTPKDAAISWQESIQRDGRQPMPVLNLESLTEFNPRQCRYQNGKWIEPVN